jgi:hypothetical protein
MNADYYATQSRFTDPGALATWLDGAPDEIAAIRSAASRLVFHYTAYGDITQHGFGPERRAEIDLRYADAMFARLHTLNPAAPGGDRATTERVVGCCRDHTLLFVAMARHRGIPARSRVGFGTYLMADWAMDHVIAEVWDAAQQRWRLVEPQFEAGFTDPSDGTPLDLLDVPRDKFLVGADAWRACRAGARDPERFIVAPHLTEPFLRSWSYLMHNLVLDLAALRKDEMILWDLWGPLATTGPSRKGVSERLDALAESLAEQQTALNPPDLPASFDDLRVPGVVTSVTPPGFAPRHVTLRKSS